MSEPQTAPPGQPAGLPVEDTLYDTGNPLIATGIPVRLLIGKIPTPAGELGIITIRNTSTTLTVTLTRKDVCDWIGMLEDLRDQMSDSGLMVAGRPGLIRTS